ncbi:MAG: nucleoside-diphosphate kinase [Planctomycetes bacterium]|nr:nucleoside-diphosphate kinase [Planctomycetota bacterium]
MERTFVMIKPDGVQRRLVGRIVNRIEEKGLRVAGLKLLSMKESQATELYSVHKGKPFYDGLVKFVTSSPVVVMVIEGAYAIKVVRALLGATFGYDAAPGTIRGDFGTSKGFNLVHGSDSPESAQREIPIFFRPEEVVAWSPADANWVYEGPERA